MQGHDQLRGITCGGFEPGTSTRPLFVIKGVAPTTTSENEVMTSKNLAEIQNQLIEAKKRRLVTERQAVEHLKVLNQAKSTYAVACEEHKIANEEVRRLYEDVLVAEYQDASSS